MKLVERGKSIVFYATFKNQDGSEATLTGTPTIEVYRMVNNVKKQEISATQMTQVDGSTYSYEYSVPAAKALGDYVAKYRATYSDPTDVVGEEEFRIIAKGALDTQKGAGLNSRQIILSNKNLEKKILDDIYYTNQEI